MNKTMNKAKAILFISLLILTFALVTPYVQAFRSPKSSNQDKKMLFRFAQITDTQPSSENDIYRLSVTIYFLIEMGVDFVVHTGDITSGASEEEFIMVKEHLDILTDNNITYFTLKGNHDGDGILYQQYFGELWYYNIIDDFIFIFISWNETDTNIPNDAITWTQILLSQHQDKYGVVCLHRFNSDLAEGHQNSPDPNLETAWTALKDIPNLLMFLSGHNHDSEVEIRRATDKHYVYFVNTDSVGQSENQGYIRFFEVYDKWIFVKSCETKNLKQYDPLWLQGSEDIFWIKLRELN